MTAAGVLTVALLAAGCSDGTSISSPFSTKPPVLLHGPSYEITTGTVSGLGTVLVDGRGISVYMYATDVRGQPSRCYDICAVQWPPVVLPPTVTRPVAGPGIRPALLGTSPRTDGATQVTYNGWPLYLWPPDKAPGQATGQALTNAGGALVRALPRREADRDPVAVTIPTETSRNGTSPMRAHEGDLDVAAGAAPTPTCRAGQHRGSLWSINSTGSILSVNSTGSILSIGSMGSILSIGSMGSLASFASIGSVASVASALSARSAFALLSYRSVGSRLAVRGQSRRSRDSR